MKKYWLFILSITLIVLGISSFSTIVSAQEDPIVNSEVTNIGEATYTLTEDDKDGFNSLNDEEIDSKEIEINNTYNEGDILSEEDTIFLLNLINEKAEYDSPLLRAGKSQQSVNQSLTKFGTKVTLSGTMYQNISTVAGTSSFRGAIKATRNSGSLKKVALTTHHSSYGMVGWNGKYPSIGLVYKGTVSMDKSSYLDLTQMDKSTNYNSILSSYTTMYSQATVTTSKGDQYTITSPTWKKFH